MSGFRTGRVIYTSARLTIDIHEKFEESRSRFEEAVPELPLEQVASFVRRNGAWSEMLELVKGWAPLGFLIYSSNFVDPVMHLAGDSGSCVTYMMGNHTIAERMFRFDPSVMLYAPLRVALWTTSDEMSHFTFDLPSDLFGSFSQPEIRSVGFELNGKIVRLLEHLRWDVPSELLQNEAK
jgi:hypothetical protein